LLLNEVPSLKIVAGGTIIIFANLLAVNRGV